MPNEELIVKSVKRLRETETESLQRELESLRENHRDLVRLYTYSLEQVNNLKAKKFARFNEDECWIYDPEDDNHLESLVCPVVISPQELLKLKNDKLLNTIRDYANMQSLTPHQRWEQIFIALKISEDNN